MNNALVTGGIQGIGLAIVKKLLARGDKVTVFDYVNSKDERVLYLHDLDVSYIQVDVSYVDSIKQGFSKLAEPIDILVNNAGIARDGMALRLCEKDWDVVMNVNAKGAFFCSQQALKMMIRKQKSYIVNMASVVGIIGNPGQVNYAASKAAVIAMTKTLAKEYALRNVLVNAIAPGFIQTKMTDDLSDKVKEHAKTYISLKRFGDTQDVANLVAFLTSGEADYITGQVIHVDGGMVI